MRVAPFTGAWIEMVWLMNVEDKKITSLPSRERGLKFVYLIDKIHRLTVAPFTGAWIEIACTNRLATSATSLPSRERGLKYPPKSEYINNHPSLPSRERGLKSHPPMICV